ncbi:protein of unknown function [Variovorax sp. OK212]|nr:protein of unknown function [Variovorax sp. OK202]SFE77433.1 protein of unknown function [Variovorax sp. OK212]
MLHFKPLMQALSLDEVLGEIVLINSHDGRSAYQLRAGLFQPVCTNRMLPALGDVGFVYVSHRGSVMPNVVDATQKITQDLPQGQPLDFAREGLALRFADQDAAPLAPVQLLERRPAREPPRRASSSHCLSRWPHTGAAQRTGPNAGDANDQLKP